jgi:hypothetical protein
MLGGVRSGWVLLVLLLFVLSPGLALAAQPAALEPGVHVDPRSPAAKEYALPLAQARKTGGGGASGGHGLFGAGIRRLGAEGRRNGARRSSGERLARRGRQGTATQRSSEAAASASGTLADARKGTAGASGGDSLLALLGGGVAVLVVGVLAGTILRRRPVRPRV